MTEFEKLIHRKISRRNFLKKTGKATAFLTAGAILPEEFFGIQSLAFKAIRDAQRIQFTPIEASDSDSIILPEGFNYKIIRMWGDKINDAEDYGYNNDFVAYIPIDFHSGGKNPEDGLLVVNHEYPLPVFINGYTDADFKNNRIKTADEIDAEKRSVGVSVFRVKRIAGEWNFVEDEVYNRRYDAKTPFKVCGYAKEKFPELVTGTLANCSGGLTPWGTMLSGEENFQDYFTSKNHWEYRWNNVDSDFNEEHYGWVIEIDPFDKNTVPKKRTSLGRFRHENVTVGICKDGRIAAYMGDDKVNECVYKFISKDKFDSSNLSNNADILDEGDLYVADFKNNIWQLLDINKREELRKEFTSQAEVLINCDRSSKLAGGTECNRPEDIEIDHNDNSIYIAFTNNSKKKDYFGSIVRIIEKDNDHASEKFEWEVFATGGVESGFSCPDNMAFDKAGNLWVLCNVSSGSLNKGRHLPFKNNAMFMIPTSGPDKGKAFRFASGPVDAEFCGGNFTPDGSTMFTSVQHPGENTTSLENPTSRWPNYGNDVPRPAVIAITGFKYD